MLKTKSGETVVDASKQLASELDLTMAATLVPPEPKAELSLTWKVGVVCSELRKMCNKRRREEGFNK